MSLHIPIIVTANCLVDDLLTLSKEPYGSERNILQVEPSARIYLSKPVFSDDEFCRVLTIKTEIYSVLHHTQKTFSVDISISVKILKIDVRLFNLKLISLVVFNLDQASLEKLSIVKRLKRFIRPMRHSLRSF